MVPSCLTYFRNELLLLVIDQENDMQPQDELSHLPCYVLTLEDPGGKRFENAKHQLKHLPVEPRYVQGYRLADCNSAGVYSKFLNLLLMKRKLTPGEVSVYLGHRKIWQQMLDEGRQTALVFEDDFFITERNALLQSIKDALSIADSWDIIKFFDFRPKRIVRRCRIGKTDFVQYKYCASGCVAYLIQAPAAEKLLKRSRIYRPVDEDWSHPWEFNLQILSVDPAPVREIASELGGSLLEAGRLSMKRQHRNWLRSLYGNVLSAAKSVRAWFWNFRAIRRLPQPSSQQHSSHQSSTTSKGP